MSEDESKRENENIIKKYPDVDGSCVVNINDKGEGFVYDAIKGCTSPIPDFPSQFDGLLWDLDSSCKHMFLTYSLDSLYVNLFVYWPKGASSGSKLYRAGQFKTFDRLDITPMSLKGSVVYSITSDGSSVESASISESQPEDWDPFSGAINKLDRLISLKLFPAAAEFCRICQNNDFWQLLGINALAGLDFETAIEAYVQQGLVGVAMDLDALSYEEDPNLCMGDISLILGKFKRAMQYYLKSSRKDKAVLMKTYLQSWNEAFDLAKQYSPNLICLVSKEYALAEENRGNYLHALQLFEEFVKHSTVEDSHLISECEAGLARNCIRCEQVERGLELMSQLTDVSHITTCAEALVTKKYYTEAIEFFEAYGEWDRAASLYIIQKDWVRFKSKIHNITSPAVFRQYAQAKEMDGEFEEASWAFEQIDDLSNACRICLKSGQFEEALHLARTTGDYDSIKTICNYFLGRGDVGTAMRFLVKAGHLRKAMTIALSCDRVDLYASTLMEFSPPATPPRVSEEYRESMAAMAKCCKEMGEFNRAAEYFLLSSNPTAAFDLLVETARFGRIECDIDFLNLVTKTVPALNSKDANQLLEDYYAGKLDGEPKDPRLFLRLAITIESWATAAELALIVAMEEQRAANYLAAHCTLLYICMELKYNGVRIPKKNLQALEIIHVYMLSRIHASRGYIMTAARLLLRLSNRVEQFPSHEIQLLTSTVLQCAKAGLKNAAMTVCFILMTPENRPKIEDKYKSKMELMLRKFGKTDFEDMPDSCSPCPFCHAMIPDFELWCNNCSTLIPFCIATGRHTIRDDLTCCPSCKFPAIRSEFIRFLQDDEFSICPMCDANLDPLDLLQINNPDKFLQTFVPYENVTQMCSNSGEDSSEPSRGTFYAEL